MLRHAILLILANAVALFIATQVLPGDFLITGGWTGIVVAGLIFGILNSIVKPILKIVSLPFVFITAGLFTLVINGAMLWLAKYALDVLALQGVAITINGGFLTWAYATLIVGVANVILHWLVKKN
ncbi:phage holin family protein [Candidatus Peregrinibacteria bacterium]|nr:phage holin family protein [Candidatus Peregrinibacteria bacterium]